MLSAEGKMLSAEGKFLQKFDVQVANNYLQMHLLIMTTFFGVNH